MSLVCLAEVAVVVTIVVLDRVSARNNGVATVPNVSSPSTATFQIAHLRQYYGLLWTTLPSLILTLYGFMWAAVVSGTADRQPFVELARPKHKATNARRTIMLDYRAYPGFYSWVVALRNGHVLLGFSMVLALVLSIAAIPLSAHIFVAASTTFRSEVSVDFPTQYNAEAFTSKSNLQPAIDLATAVHAYGSQPPAWMTTEYAFQPFEAGSQHVTGNLTGLTQAYSAYLDCQVIDQSSTFILYDEGDPGTVTVSWTDRHCEVEQMLTVTPNTDLYLRSWKANCDDNISPRRLGLISGLYSESSSFKLTNFSIVSCIPSYWITTGSLTVSLAESSSSPGYVSFNESNSTNVSPSLALVLADTLYEYTIFNPAAAVSADAFGFSVYSAAKEQNSQSPVTSELIKNCTEQVFTTVYAALATDQLFQESTGSSPSQTALLVVPTTRLFIVRPIAYVVVGIFLAILICNCCLFIYTQRHQSILKEEPVGLLGNALVLHRSEVLDRVTELLERDHPEGSPTTTRELIKKSYTVTDSKCYWDHEAGIIAVDDLEAKAELFPPSHCRHLSLASISSRIAFT
jgi:hypothetical protein